MTNKPFDGKGLIILTGILSSLFLSSCTATHHVEFRPGRGGDYAIASWYGKKYDGRLTASGERFDMYAMTCAHRSLPFGTRLRVTNPDTNKSVIVTVNDRGPFVRGRDLDLSYAAAKKIGILNQGVERVIVEYID